MIFVNIRTAHSRDEPHKISTYTAKLSSYLFKNIHIVTLTEFMPEVPYMCGGGASQSNVKLGLFLKTKKANDYFEELVRDYNLEEENDINNKNMFITK